MIVQYAFLCSKQRKYSPAFALCAASEEFAPGKLHHTLGQPPDGFLPSSGKCFVFSVYSYSGETMNNDKKVKYVKVGEEPVTTKAKRTVRRAAPEKLTVGQIIFKSAGVIGTTLASIVLIIVIAACIVATGLALYITQFAETDFDLSLEDAELNTSSFIYAYDADGNEVMIKQLSSDQNRVLINIEDLPPHVINAFIAIEDARFYDHDGVDWKRTVAVTVRMFVSGGTEGGSTITQQLVRDITGDKEVTIGRKLREIFRALEMEKKYTKSDILESYLNRIGFGGTSYGIASASYRYFDKTPDQLTIAEAAILAGIVRSPTAWNPYADLESCKGRQKEVLKQMYQQGYISTQEYEDALAEQVRFRLPVKGDWFGYEDERYNEYYGIQDENDTDDDLYYENVSWEELGVEESNYEPYKWNGDYEVTQNWYVDAAIDQIIGDLAELRGITYDAARTLFYKGGFKAYLNMDIEMQNKVEEVFRDPYNVLRYYNENETDPKNLIQGAFVIMNYSGSVLALVGGIGEKEGDGCFNRATQDTQMIGSTIKPLSVYSLAIEKNLITYSTEIRNIAGKLPVEAMGDYDYESDPYYDPEEGTTRWPYNFNKTIGDNLYYPVWYAVEKSLNTVAVNVLNRVGVQYAFTHLTEKLHFTLDPVNDMSFSPMALGAFTDGITLTTLTAAYAIMGNGGLYYEPYLYSKVVDSDGRIVLSQNVVGESVISPDTAWITNRLMRTVITDPNGSGINANLADIEVVGKTGTANDTSAYAFVGLTPKYVACFRISRDNHQEIPQSGAGWEILALVWRRVMESVTEGEGPQSFTPNNEVVELNYCTETGLIATDACPDTKLGYYRISFLPQACDSKHDGRYWTEHGSDEVPLYGWQ